MAVAEWFIGRSRTRLSRTRTRSIVRPRLSATKGFSTVSIGIVVVSGAAECAQSRVVLLLILQPHHWRIALECRRGWGVFRRRRWNRLSLKWVIRVHSPPRRPHPTLTGSGVWGCFYCCQSAEEGFIHYIMMAYRMGISTLNFVVLPSSSYTWLDGGAPDCYSDKGAKVEFTTEAAVVLLCGWVVVGQAMVGFCSAESRGNCFVGATWLRCV